MELCQPRTQGRVLFGWLLALSLPATLQAALQPDEVAILAVRTSKQSRELAEYYAEARRIPKSHICLLDLAATETLSRNDWESKVRPAIRRWLTANQLDTKIRCFVTVWDVPLKIGKQEPQHPQAIEIQKFLEAQQKLRQEQVLRLAVQIDEVLAADTPGKREPPAAGAAQKDYANLLEAVVKDSHARLLLAQERKDAELPQAVSRLERLYVQAGGMSALLRSIQIQVQSNARLPAELIKNFEMRRGEMTGLRIGLAALSNLREGTDRDQQILTLLQQSDGVLGSLQWIEQNRELWRKNETHSSFDSELALLHFSPYALLRWQNNFLHHAVDSLTRESLPRTLMVARLEAPTLEQARQLVDSAIEIEKTGLLGKVYIDARGMPADKNAGSYGDYDQSLRDLARLLQEQTALDVVLDDKNELFQPGQCADAALYCGWYSLAKYVDAFQWKRGAVGYHLASGEATTLRKLDSNVWCKRMLESGVCATLGPTYEPYLTAFPRPLDFFPLLLTGELTLAEVYARTNPYNSWVMVLVGDPLYNPFKNRPRFDRQNLPEALQRMLPER